MGAGRHRGGRPEGVRAAGRRRRTRGPDPRPRRASPGRCCPSRPSWPAAVQGGHRPAAWPLRRRPGAALGKRQARARQRTARPSAASAEPSPPTGRQPTAGGGVPARPAAAARRWGDRLVGGQRPAAGAAPPAAAVTRLGRRHRPDHWVGRRGARHGVASATPAPAAACPGRDGGRAPGRGRAGCRRGRAPRPGSDPAAPTRKAEKQEDTHGRQPEAAGRLGRRVRSGSPGWSRTLRAHRRGRPPAGRAARGPRAHRQGPVRPRSRPGEGGRHRQRPAPAGQR